MWCVWRALQDPSHTPYDPQTSSSRRQVVRKNLKVKKRDFSDLKLKQMWCAIDTDESDSIAQVEFGRFVRLAKGKVQAPKASYMKHT